MANHSGLLSAFSRVLIDKKERLLVKVLLVLTRTAVPHQDITNQIYLSQPPEEHYRVVAVYDKRVTLAY